MLAWEYSERFKQHYLMLDGFQVAMVDDGPPGWYRVIVNQQRSMGKLVSGKAPTLEHGKKMAERWARANLPRLEQEVAEKDARRHRMPWLPKG